MYFDNPPPRITKATVTQLEDLVHSASDLPRKLANLEFTERLSMARLDALLELIHDEQERQTVTAVADLSAALAPRPTKL